VMMMFLLRRYVSTPHESGRRGRRGSWGKDEREGRELMVDGTCQPSYQ
jgi:hypothetical protein